jgi:hypothetical protein
MCWVLFQPELAKSLVMFQKMFSIDGGLPLPLSNRSLWYTVLFVACCHLWVSRGWWQRLHAALPPWLLGFGYAVCLCVAMLLAPDNGTTFIYFTF